MALFRLAADGKPYFTFASKYSGKALEEVAKVDPRYMRWVGKASLEYPMTLEEQEALAYVLQVFGIKQ
jgi:hypothetical protein